MADDKLAVNVQGLAYFRVSRLTLAVVQSAIHATAVAQQLLIVVPLIVVLTLRGTILPPEGAV